MNVSASGGTLNLSSQRISFVNKIGIILKATADDESPAPGYLFKDITDISYESVGYSESLVEFLVDRVKNKSVHVKYKTLKLMKHVVEKGSREFRLGLRKHSDVVKECTKFGGPPHPMHGNAPYLMIRNIAKELCESLYNIDHDIVQSPTFGGDGEIQPETKYGGLGPMRSGGAIQGFGNTPTNPQKGLGGTILEEIEKLGAKISETPADRQAALLAKLDLSGSTSNYQPPVVNAYIQDNEDGREKVSATSGVWDEENSSAAGVKRPVKKHTPGRAGGGWGDDDDDDESQSVTSEEDQKSDTPANEDQRHQGDDSQGEEVDLVKSILSHGSTGPDNALLRPSEVFSFIEKCAKLNINKIVQLLPSHFTSENSPVALRALQVLEGIVFNESELIRIDIVVAATKDFLVTCYQSNTYVQRLEASPESLQDTEGSENLALRSMISAKAAKLILAFQQLSASKDILPLQNFESFLPDSQKRSMESVG